MASISFKGDLPRYADLGIHLHTDLMTVEAIGLKPFLMKSFIFIFLVMLTVGIAKLPKL